MSKRERNVAVVGLTLFALIAVIVGGFLVSERQTIYQTHAPTVKRWSRMADRAPRGSQYVVFSVDAESQPPVPILMVTCFDHPRVLTVGVIADRAVTASRVRYYVDEMKASQTEDWTFQGTHMLSTNPRTFAETLPANGTLYFQFAHEAGMRTLIFRLPKERLGDVLEREPYCGK